MLKLKAMETKLTLKQIQDAVITHLYELNDNPSDQLIALIKNSETILDLAISIEDSFISGMFFIIDSLSDNSVKNKQKELTFLLEMEEE